MMEQNYLQWLAGDTQTVWWHDSAEMALAKRAFENGASGMTTNPFLMASALHADRSGWAEITRGIEAFSGDEKALELERRVVAHYRRDLEPLWENGGWGQGGICAQVNPGRIGSTDYMIEQMKRIAAFAPNVFVKLPATGAGVRAFEEGIANGCNVCATVGFTVPQAVAVAEANVRGIARAQENGLTPGKGIAVIMAGRLDDYIRDIVADNGLAIPESDIIQCGLACVKKAYKLYGERNYPTMLMTAAPRGTYHVTELAGAKLIMSIAPKIEEELLKANTEKTEKFREPIAPETLERLMTVREFVKAYAEDGMTEKEFITYGPANRTATQFVESGWNRLVCF